LTNIDICRKCFSNNTSCCTLRSDNKEKMMIPPVSEKEIEKILIFLGYKKREMIFESKNNSTFYIHQMLNLFPEMEESVFEAFPENGKHFELKTLDNACILLRDSGCILPKDVRPHFCRIYPFWFFEAEPRIFQDSNCLALRNYETISGVLLSLGTNSEAIQQIHSQICQDWELFHSITQKEMKLSF
jgi:Fe-S-cluster containining protein